LLLGDHPHRDQVSRNGAITVHEQFTPFRRYSPREWCRNGPGPAVARPGGRPRELTIRPPCASNEVDVGSLERDTRWLLTGWHWWTCCARGSTRRSTSSRRVCAGWCRS